MRFSKLQKYLRPLDKNSRKFKTRLKKQKGNISGRKQVLLSKGKQLPQHNYYLFLCSWQLKGLHIILDSFTSSRGLIYNLALHYSGVQYITKAPYGSFLGNYIFNLTYKLRNLRLFPLGSCITLHQANKGDYLYFLKAFYGSSCGFAASNGTYILVESILRELNLALIKLPSGVRLYVALDSVGYLGRNAGIHKRYQNLGKAGARLYLGYKMKVRGVAQNPVDHPHGGRTKTNCPEVSLWGWVTKYSH